MMKSIFLAFAVLICGCSPSFAADRSVGQSYKFSYTIVSAGGSFVGSQVPTVKIQKVSNGYWYDFNDSTFKASGWSNKTTVLTEDSTNGIYYYSFTPPAAETTQDQYLFVVDNVDLTYPDHQMYLVNYDDIIGAINRARGR